MRVADRQKWAARVIREIAEWDLRGTRAVVLAGQNYREFLMNPLTARFDTVDVPMKGLQMGEQLSWMKNLLGG
nr:DUF6884 domain-containing protein [Bradyrhizobium sp. SZCCHNPS1003]